MSSKAGLPAGCVGALSGGIDTLVRSLATIKQGESYSFFGAKQLQPSLDVFVLHRNYPASVKPDYVNRFRLQHDYCRVVFGLNAEHGTLVIKIANKAIASAIRDWVKATLSCELTNSRSIFTGYDANRFRSYHGRV